MGELIKVLIWIVGGIILLWFGYSLFFGKISPHYPYFIPKNKKLSKKDYTPGEPGDPQTCLVCSMKLVKGSHIKTTAFPSVSGGIDRLMYVHGCNICLSGNAQRSCPVCQSVLDIDDYLVARMFERQERKNHVHVLGCNRCRNTGSLAR